MSDFEKGLAIKKKVEEKLKENLKKYNDSCKYHYKISVKGYGGEYNWGSLNDDFWSCFLHKDKDLFMKFMMTKPSERRDKFEKKYKIPELFYEGKSLYEDEITWENIRDIMSTSAPEVCDAKLIVECIKSPYEKTIHEIELSNLTPISYPTGHDIEKYSIEYNIRQNNPIFTHYGIQVVNKEDKLVVLTKHNYKGRQVFSTITKSGIWNFENLYLELPFNPKLVNFVKLDWLTDISIHQGLCTNIIYRKDPQPFIGRSDIILNVVDSKTKYVENELWIEYDSIAD